MQQKVLIVGSGPAGLSAAFFLSGHGFDVTVAERLGNDQYDRYHRICGGGISRSTFKTLSPMEPKGILNEFEHTKLIWPDGTEIRMRTPGYILDRPTFLSHLRSDCEDDVRFIHESVDSICMIDGGFSVHSLDGDVGMFDWVIGADGASSIVRKDIFGSEPVSSCSATEFTVDRQPDDELIIRLSDNGSGSYSWEFPHGDMTSTGGMKGEHSEDEYIFRGSRKIPVGGVGRIVKGHAFLIGDAAAMANPVCYGGLKAALIAGRKAAESIIRDDPERLQRWWDGSILSDRRFMDFNRRLKEWTPEDMHDAVRPFKSGHVILPGIFACITRPRNIHMYFGCLFAFRYGW